MLDERKRYGRIELGDSSAAGILVGGAVIALVLFGASWLILIVAAVLK